MEKCNLCGKPINNGSKTHTFYTAKLIKKEKTEALTYEETKTIYSDILRHDFKTCKRCNRKKFLLFFLTPLLSVLWLIIFFIAPLNGINIIIPAKLMDMPFNFWTFIFGVFYFLFSLFGFFVILGLGFTWRSRNIELKAFENRGVDKTNQYRKLSSDEYEKLKFYKDDYFW